MEDIQRQVAENTIEIKNIKDEIREIKKENSEILDEFEKRFSGYKDFFSREIVGIKEDLKMNSSETNKIKELLSTLDHRLELSIVTHKNEFEKLSLAIAQMITNVDKVTNKSQEYEKAITNLTQITTELLKDKDENKEDERDNKNNFWLPLAYTTIGGLITGAAIYFLSK